MILSFNGNKFCGLLLNKFWFYDFKRNGVFNVKLYLINMFCEKFVLLNWYIDVWFIPFV